MSTGPKLPPLPVLEGDEPLWSSIDAWRLSKDALGAFRASQAIDESVAAIALAYGLQCFEAGRQQGMTQADALHGLAASSQEIEAGPQWQPIETAPKDGTLILLSRGPMVCAGAWRPELDAEYPWTLLESYGNPATDNAWVEDAPKHWMPLPSPPKA